MYRSAAILEASGVTVAPPPRPKNSTSTSIPMAIPSLLPPIRLRRADVASVPSGSIKVNEAMDDTSSTDNSSSTDNNSSSTDNSSSTNNDNNDNSNSNSNSNNKNKGNNDKTIPTAVDILAVR